MAGKKEKSPATVTYRATGTGIEAKVSGTSPQKGHYYKVVDDEDTLERLEWAGRTAQQAHIRLDALTMDFHRLEESQLEANLRLLKLVTYQNYTVFGLLIAVVCLCVGLIAHVL